MNKKRKWWRKHVTAMQAVGIERMIDSIYKFLLINAIAALVIALIIVAVKLLGLPMP